MAALPISARLAMAPTHYDNDPDPINEIWYERAVQLADRLARLHRGLVALYQEHPADVARVCDEVIDPSGKLLGEIRREVRR